MKKIIFIFCLFSVGVCHAQTQSPYDVPALQQKLMAEISENLQLRSSLLAANAEIKKLQDEIVKMKLPQHQQDDNK